MPLAFKLALNTFKIIKLAIDNDPQSLIITGYRLIACGKVDDGVPIATEKKTTIFTVTGVQ